MPSYSLDGLRLSHRLLVIIANEHPEGVTAKDIADVFESWAYITVYRTLQRLTMQGYLRRVETDERAGNNRPAIFYYATKKAKQQVNYQMNKLTDGEWRDLPLYSDVPRK